MLIIPPCVPEMTPCSFLQRPARVDQVGREHRRRNNPDNLVDFQNKAIRADSRSSFNFQNTEEEMIYPYSAGVRGRGKKIKKQMMT